MSENISDTKIIRAKVDRKSFKPSVKTISKIPEEILNNELLKTLSKALPSNYNFEIPKTIWRIRQLNAKTVALQMPEGLLMFATTIADIIEIMTGADSIIMGDVTYGACCVDDFTAKALKVDLLLHYGHSCLIPIDQTLGIQFLYIFVDIKIDSEHLIRTIKLNFQTDVRLAFVSTIQFVTTLQSVSQALRDHGYTVLIPQSKPLSSGEVLGCTAPIINDCNAIIYIGDGRFHLEAAMIANPSLEAYRYDPYEKKLSRELYSHDIMKRNRFLAIETAKKAETYGLILGVLGRQGNFKVLEYFQNKLREHKKSSVVILLSEVLPGILKMMPKIDAWMQIACPRLSIDWGTVFLKPLLTPYEFNVALHDCEPKWKTDNTTSYPMDFYASNSLGPWTPNYKTDHDIKYCKKKK